MKTMDSEKRLGTAAIACLFAVIAACSDGQDPAEARIDAIVAEGKAKREQVRAKCEALQAKVDAEGRPGWDSLSAELKEELKDVPARCTIIGDERQF
ncbi:MAG: hypothetical protein AAGL90_04675 [Pseudomonadota bacterium]